MSRSRSRSATARSSSQSSKKSLKSNSNESPSGSATITGGRDQLDTLLRSVLSDPLCLPLLVSLHGHDPGELDFLGRNRGEVSDKTSKELDNIFKTAVDEWAASGQTREQQLTKSLSDKINAHSKLIRLGSKAEVEVQCPRATGRENEMNLSSGRSDILLLPSPKEEGSQKTSTEKKTPLALIEVGLTDKDWFLKLDQGVKYLKGMASTSQKELEFKKPILLAVMTVEVITKEDKTREVGQVKLGVFLCCRRNEKSLFRMTLLRRCRTTNLQDASNAFGQLLRVASDLSSWRSGDGEPPSPFYKYLSSNCCQVQNREKKYFVS